MLFGRLTAKGKLCEMGLLCYVPIHLWWLTGHLDFIQMIWAKSYCRLLLFVITDWSFVFNWDYLHPLISALIEGCKCPIKIRKHPELTDCT